MLQITIPGIELFNEMTREFINTKDQTLTLEHSLVSISKWESKWCKPFFSKEEKTQEETRDYIRCMTITQNVDPNVYYGLTENNINQVLEYINAPMTATFFSEDTNRRAKSNGGKVITNEVIYYWMTAYNIPAQYEKWHINRLLTLIRVCNEENKPPSKMSKREIMSSNAQLNAARRQKYKSKG